MFIMSIPQKLPNKDAQSVQRAERYSRGATRYLGIRGRSSAVKNQARNSTFLGLLLVSHTWTFESGQ